ncbi:MAG: NUDIX hydrolase [Streptosporangiaceae bacterium]
MEEDTAQGSAAGSMAHEVLAVIFQVRDGELCALLWRRGRPPHAGAWALPGGALDAREDLDASIRRQLAQKVDVRELAHLEQLETRGAPERHPGRRVLATGYVGLVPAHVDPDVPGDTAWHPVDAPPETAFDHGEFVVSARRRLRAKLSYTNIGFALAPPTFTMSELRSYYRAALGHDVSTTNLQRVLLRRGQIEPTGEALTPGRTGGRPAAVYRFRARRLEITDAFAVLRPPAKIRIRGPEAQYPSRPDP